jgi:hypothetical protein
VRGAARKGGPYRAPYLIKAAPRRGAAGPAPAPPLSLGRPARRAPGRSCESRQRSAQLLRHADQKHDPGAHPPDRPDASSAPASHRHAIVTDSSRGSVPDPGGDEGLQPPSRTFPDFLRGKRQGNPRGTPAPRRGEPAPRAPLTSTIRTTRRRKVHAGLLPVRHCPRRASLVKAFRDRRATGHRGKMPGVRTREDGLDKPGPRVAEFAPIGSREGDGQNPSTPHATPVEACPEPPPTANNRHRQLRLAPPSLDPATTPEILAPRRQQTAHPSFIHPRASRQDMGSIGRTEETHLRLISRLATRAT